jgi:hypothetical protein
VQNPAEQLLVPGAGFIECKAGQRGADGRSAGIVSGLGAVPPWQRSADFP